MLDSEKNEDDLILRRCQETLKLDTGKHSNHSEISLGEIIDEYLNNGVAIDIESQHYETHLSTCSKEVNRPKSDITLNSIPSKLRKFYSHNSFRQIILSILSLSSISFTFAGLFSGKLEACESLAFVSSVILLFSPSPLQLCR